MEMSNLQDCSPEGLHDVCESTELLDHVAMALKEAGVNASDPLASAATNVSSAGFYFGFCALISHILLAGITAAVVHKCVSLKMVHTAGHAFYCTVGFVFLLGEALLVRNSSILESWFNLQLLHTCLILLAFLVGVGGVAIKTLQKRERKREDPNATVKHFRSNHGFPGIIGCVLLLCTILTDLPLYYTTSKSLELIQRFLALSSFLALMISQMFSYNTGFARRQWKAHHVRLFKLFTFIAIVTTMNYEFRIFVREVVTSTARQLTD